MGKYVLRNVVQGSYFLVHANRLACAKLDSRETLRRTIRLAFALFVIFAMANPSAAVAGFVFEKNFTGVGGNAVAIAGERIVIGAPQEDNMTGAVYVYRYNSVTKEWEKEAKLVALDGAAGDQFGTSVAIAESRIVVGAPTDTDNGFQSGSAYVFRYYPETPGWSQEQKIIASDGTSNDFFGLSTAISDNRVVIGSPLEGGTTSNRGAVYVYELSSVEGWIQQYKIVSFDGGSTDQLGTSIAIEGDRIVAGASLNKPNDVQSGSVYVFLVKSDSNSWELETKLTPLDGKDFDLFGSAVKIDGDRIIAGTMFAGYANVFRRNNDGWVREQKLEPLDGTGGGEFGSAVAIAGDRVVVGAPVVNSRRGSAFLFAFDPVKATWVQEQILTDSNASEGARFGRSVAIAGERVVVGEPGSEAAYAFRFIPDSDGDRVLDDQDRCPNTPSGAVVDANGCAASQLDTDGDGVTDDREQCDNSDIRPTIIIGTCDSGVVNVLSMEEPAGCSITDEIMKLAADAKSHGQFLSQVDKFLQELQSDGILEPNEKNAIKDCAAQSDLP